MTRYEYLRMSYDLQAPRMRELAPAVLYRQSQD